MLCHYFCKKRDKSRLKGQIANFEVFVKFDGLVAIDMSENYHEANLTYVAHLGYFKHETSYRPHHPTVYIRATGWYLLVFDQRLTMHLGVQVHTRLVYNILSRWLGACVVP